MSRIQYLLEDFGNLHMPTIRVTDIVEVLIIAFLVYHFLRWIKNTRAWLLLKGVAVIVVFILIAVIFEMNTIIWIVQNIIGVAAISIVVVLQPELRKALEDLGQKNIISNILQDSGSRLGEGLLTDKTVSEIVKACVEMGKVKTGALIVIENKQPLGEYARTGIDIDAILTSQLLINIFEKNTPLHDGAVIVRGNRVISATCYLPLSDSTELSKELGTRHRAGVGISEATDSMTVIVSEETGGISVAFRGVLETRLDGERLKERLAEIQNKPVEEPKNKKRMLRKVRSRNEA